MGSRNTSAAALRALARTTSAVTLPRAGEFFGIGVNKSYELHKLGEFPVKVLKLGGQYRVPIADLARELGIDLREPTAEDVDGGSSPADTAA